MDSTTAAMLETHGNSLLLQQDPSMAPSVNNMMNMNFTDGSTNIAGSSNASAGFVPIEA